MGSKHRGFSLIEVMIAFVLIGVGALGLVKLQAYIEQRADFALHSVQALNLAEQQLEWFRTHGASSASPSWVHADFDTDIVSGEDFSHPGYALSWQVPAATVSGSLKTVVITASWLDRQGQSQSIELQTAVSRYNQYHQ
ncbi:type IV pilus modification PilV family protein [Vibrio furnissii]|uniref:type IV pilus modification PilV family protein n=1 Tax=Vibrio furnissii TaxID=29494 RepID=UPI0001B928B6|nr:prepilin-type N-terminal cleavage/methylation domain-containing protein [Vibrio furnissii]EEX38833.1 type 4 fimbrial biogenesis protein PilV [Vibrio furnissii CIP 102972]QDC92394.1 prepilin-type N-terminal cleavage/methylation domain-containing protein [Vibrio furnissii]UON48970.1 prepilin-type N-terminal cleavage/methylation domain-containing protein [Vibrio furnissii]SUP44310.1 type IV pilin [Vibrio furnissii]